MQLYVKYELWMCLLIYFNFERNTHPPPNENNKNVPKSYFMYVNCYRKIKIISSWKWICTVAYTLYTVHTCFTSSTQVRRSIWINNRIKIYRNNKTNIYSNHKQNGKYVVHNQHFSCEKRVETKITLTITIFTLTYLFNSQILN